MAEGREVQRFDDSIRKYRRIFLVVGILSTEPSDRERPWRGKLRKLRDFWPEFPQPGTYSPRA
jgi:hypothetical protein